MDGLPVNERQMSIRVKVVRHTLTKGWIPPYTLKRIKVEIHAKKLAIKGIEDIPRYLNER